MSWVHDSGYAPAYDHEGSALPVLDTDLVPEEDFKTYVAGAVTPKGDRTPSANALRTDLARAHGAAVSGWYTVCSCGWKSDKVHTRYQYPAPDATAYLAPDELDEGPIQAEWREHLHQAVPELRLHTLANRTSSAGTAVDAEVQMLRLRGTSWEIIGAAVGMARQSAWERWRHLDIAAREASGADTRPAKEAFLPALEELESLADPHLVRMEVAPEMWAVRQAALGLRRLLTPTGSMETDDAVARLESAADYARAVHAAAMGSVEAVATAILDSVSADVEGVAVDQATLKVYDGESGDHQVLAVAWTGSLDEPPVMRVGGREVSDPVEVQRVAHALEILSKAAANTLYPATDDVSTS